METLMIQPETNDYQNNLSAVRYVYLNKTRCRFNISGLKNSNIFAKHLTNKLHNHEGIRNIKPSTITGNVLIEFNPQSINHKEIFSRVQIVVKDFLQKESFSTGQKIIPLFSEKNTKMVPSYSIDQQTYYKPKRDCTICLKPKPDSNNSYFSLNNIVLHIAIEAVGSLILGSIAKRIVGKSLYRFIF